MSPFDGEPEDIRAARKERNAKIDCLVAAVAEVLCADTGVAPTAMTRWNVKRHLWHALNHAARATRGHPRYQDWPPFVVVTAPGKCDGTRMAYVKDGWYYRHNGGWGVQGGRDSTGVLRVVASHAGNHQIGYELIPISEAEWRAHQGDFYTNAFDGQLDSPAAGAALDDPEF